MRRGSHETLKNVLIVQRAHTEEANKRNADSDWQKYQEAYVIATAAIAEAKDNLFNFTLPTHALSIAFSRRSSERANERQCAHPFLFPTLPATQSPER